MKEFNLTLNSNEIKVLYDLINNIDIDFMKEMVSRDDLPTSTNLYEWDDTLYEIWRKMEALKWK